MSEPTSYKLASVIAKILDEKQGKEISILNIANVSVIADYFVIASTDTTTQVKALSGYVKEIIKNKFSRLPLRDESDSKNRWHLLDYGEIVVHIMHKEERMYYAIEKFWSHACQITEEEWKKETEDFEI